MNQHPELSRPDFDEVDFGFGRGAQCPGVAFDQLVVELVMRQID